MHQFELRKYTTKTAYKAGMKPQIIKHNHQRPCSNNNKSF